MANRWTLYAFDWTRYRQLAPALRSAVETGDLAALDHEVEGVQDTLDDLADEQDLSVVAGALVTDLCTAGSPVVFEAGLAGLIRRMRRHPNGEEAADLLGQLVSGVPGVDLAFGGPRAPAGALREDQTRDLCRALDAYLAARKPPQPAQGLAALTRLWAAGDRAEESLADLAELVDAAAGQGLGLAALRE